MNPMIVDTDPPAKEAARPDWLRNRSWAPWAAVSAVCFGAFMGQLDASIVTLTYSSLEDEFGASLGAIQWVSLSYLLVLAVLLVPVGRASDARGRKLMYLRGFAIFSVASGACAVAPSLEFLIAFRAVQAAAQAVGLALGPTIGGVMVEQLGWRSVYWVNIPIGAVAILLERLRSQWKKRRGRSGPIPASW
jgi:MFS family permease